MAPRTPSDSSSVPPQQVRSLTETRLALAWIGRGTYDVSEWDDAFAEASDNDPESAIDELMDMPLLASYLEAGLAAFDFSCDGVGQID